MTLIGCGFPASTIGQVILSIDETSVISNEYIGNGVQWDPYTMDYGHGRLTFSDADIAKIYERLDFMQPAIVRMMINASSLSSEMALRISIITIQMSSSSSNIVKVVELTLYLEIGVAL